MGDASHVEKQEAFREMKSTMAHNSRKIDKKKFLEGDFASQAMEKTFGHRDQIDGDLKQMKEEAGLNK
jgi:hypothetical protein